MNANEGQVGPGKITAPYNFVPLSEKVYFPEWGYLASQDVPFHDGISGVLEYEIVARTPIFVRGRKSGDECQFFTTPDGRPAIPGTSVRGMLRNVMEIASFGKMTNVNDHRYGVRDLDYPELYGKHVAKLQEFPDGKGGKANKTVPLVSAGWLERLTDDEERQAQIVPCSFARVDYPRLRKLNPSYDPGQVRKSPEKYKAWGKDLAVQVKVERLLEDEELGRIGEYGEVSEIEFASGKKTRPEFESGTLVFTGQPTLWPPRNPKPNTRNKPKYHDFVFYGPEHEPLPISSRTFEDFEFIHSDRGQQHREEHAPNEEWRDWKSKFEAGKRVPVFFLLEEGGREVRALGLAMMFRLAYQYTTRDAVKHAQPLCASPKPDLAETIFGRVPESRGLEEVDLALKGRVSIGHARYHGERPEFVRQSVTAVLGAPKPSFYPAYLEQDPSQYGGAPLQVGWKGQGARTPDLRWVTFMDPGVTPRGWKRYRPQEPDSRPRLPARGGDNVQTVFRPIQAGAVFRGHIRVHNVRPVELGALLWALDFGRDPDAMHLLGMARPLGYGSVVVSIRASDCRDMEGREVELEGCRKAFTAEMERWARSPHGISGAWKDSVQIRELLACARPLVGGSTDGKYLLLAPLERINQFRDAKKQGWVLPPASDFRPRPLRRNTPTSQDDRSASAPARGALPSRPARLKHGDPARVTLVTKRHNGWIVRFEGGEWLLKGKAPADASPGMEVDVVVYDDSRSGGGTIEFKWNV